MSPNNGYDKNAEQFAKTTMRTSISVIKKGQIH